MLDSDKKNCPGLLYVYYWSIIEYCCYIHTGASVMYPEIHDELQRIGNIIGLDLASQLQSPSHCHNIISLCLFYEIFHGNYSDELSVLVPWLYGFKYNTRLAARSQNSTPSILFFYYPLFLSLSATPHITVAPLPCLGWND